MTKVFIGQSRAQGEWAKDRLVPCLKAGRAEVLIDAERFRPGGGVNCQMDAVHDQIDWPVLVLSAAYFAKESAVGGKHLLWLAGATDLDPHWQESTDGPYHIKLGTG